MQDLEKIYKLNYIKLTENADIPALNAQFTGIDGLKAQRFSFGMKIRPFGKDPTSKIDLKFSLKCGIISVSRWQTCLALPLGSVSAYPLNRG